MSTAELTASNVSAVTKKKTGSPLVRGQMHKFLPIPHVPEETTLLAAGPVTFGVEARIFATHDGQVRLRGGSIHVFDSATREEWLRFDWFENGAHYHYLSPTNQTNTVWAYDLEANGPMAPWAVRNLRERLAVMLKKAGAERLAAKVEKEGFDKSALDKVLPAAEKAYARTFPGNDMVVPARNWEDNWKRIHPQFNTYDD